jgi:hypothetical protein
MKRLLIVILIFTGCDTNSQTDKRLWTYSGSDKSNLDSYQYFLPTELFKREILGEMKVDSFLIDYISASLKKMHEPTYSNKYLGGESYRFIWLRSFHPPIIIIVRHDEGKSEVITKIGNKVSMDNSYTDVSKLSREEYEFYMGYEQGKETDSLKFKAISSKVIYHKDTDGYKVIFRHSPDQDRFPEFRRACDQIIDLSSFKNEERY